MSLNLGIVAHVDAGKTSLTERLLYDAGETAALGSVDAGTTRTDSMDLERRRGITIRAAVTSFAVDGLDITLVDTPGHPDFIAEVERSLAVLDAAVLVVSAVEGVQPQTVVLSRALQRIGVPTLVFVNKIDRSGADVERVVAQLRHRLQRDVVVLARAERPGGRDATVVEVPLDDDDVVQAVAAADDRLLASWVDHDAVRPRDVTRALRHAVRRGDLTPVLCGSAITGAGLPPLRRALTALLPRPALRDGAVAASVFAVDRDARGRRAWLRLWTGGLAVREQIAVAGQRPERITEIAISRPGGLHGVVRASGGDIAIVRGPQGWRVGDVIGRPPGRAEFRFPPPVVQALVEPADQQQRVALFAALTELADEDPLIDLQLDADGEPALRLHGEVQQEVIGALLDERYGVPVRFRDTGTVCIERIVGTGEALELLWTDDNPYLATIGLRVEPAPAGHGIEFSPGIQRGHLPPAFVAATEEGVRSALRQGLRGWAVTDCVITMTTSHYCPRQSHTHQKFNKAMSSVGADFRNLAPVVVMDAVRVARTQVCEPVDRFELDVPDEQLNAVLALLGRIGAIVVESSAADGWTRLAGELPSARVRELTRPLPDVTGGEAVLVTRFDHHAPVSGDVPTRRRSGYDPLDRATWFRNVPR